MSTQDSATQAQLSQLKWQDLPLDFVAPAPVGWHENILKKVMKMFGGFI
jgi:hypothetical protein